MERDREEEGVMNRRRERDRDREGETYRGEGEMHRVREVEERCIE